MKRQPQSRSEHLEQASFVAKVRLWFPHLLVAAIPNGAATSASSRIRLTREGLHAGMPDLMLLAPGGHVLFLEFKRVKGGRVSADQKATLARLEAMGFDAAVALGCDHALELLGQWLSSIGGGGGGTPSGDSADDFAEKLNPGLND